DWRGITGTVHQHLLTFVDLTLLIQFLKCPPHRLHILLVHGFIGIFHIYPAANPSYGVIPQRTSEYHIVTTGDDIFLEAYFGTNIAFVDNAQFLFGRNFSWQSMAIPTPHALHTFPLHGPVAWHGVLNSA